MALRRITAQDVDELRMPPSGQYGGDPRGAVDPAALLAASWQTPYDVDARRAAITKALLDQQAAQQVAAAAPTPMTPRDAAGMGTSSFDFKDSQGVGPGGSPAVTGETPGNVIQDRFFDTAQPIRSFDEDKPPPNSVPVVPQPEDVPPAPPDLPHDMPPSNTPVLTPDEDTGKGRVSVVSTPQSIRDEDQTPTPSVTTFATPNVFNAPPAGQLPTSTNVPGYPGLPDYTPTPATAPPGFVTDVDRTNKGDKQPVGFPTLLPEPAVLPEPADTPVATTPVSPGDMPTGAIPGAVTTGGKGFTGFSTTANDREGTAGGPGAPGQGKGSGGYAPNFDQVFDSTPAPAAVNAQSTTPSFGQALSQPSAISDFASLDKAAMAASSPSPGLPGGYGGIVSPGAPTGGYGGREGGAPSSLADMVGAMTSPGMPSPSSGAPPGWGDFGDFTPSAADMALSAPGGFDMSGSATGGNAGPGMGMSEGAAAAAAAAAAASEGGSPAGDQGGVAGGAMGGGGMGSVSGAGGAGPGMGMSEGAAAAAAAAADAAAAAAAAEGEGGGQEGGGDEGGAAP